MRGGPEAERSRWAEGAAGLCGLELCLQMAKRGTTVNERAVWRLARNAGLVSGAVVVLIMILYLFRCTSWAVT